MFEKNSSFTWSAAGRPVLSKARVVADSMKSETQTVRTRWMYPPTPTVPARLIYCPVSCSETDDAALRRHLRDTPADRGAALVVFFDWVTGDDAAVA